MDINEIRDGINSVDERLLEYFTERMRLSDEIAAYKHQNRLPVTNKEREREVLRRAQESSGEYGQYAYELFRTLIELSKARQHELYPRSPGIGRIIEKALESVGEAFPRTGIVACQGVEGANSQAACDKLFPRGSIVYVNTFEAVFDAVDAGICQFGVLPVENSANGTVRAVYDLLRRKRFSIVRMLSLHIRHELLANPGADIAGIREIHSHEQAIGQCSRFLASLGSGVRIIPCSNTAVAAKTISESGRMDCAAISSHSCAELYGLSVLNDRISDSENNYTRFICVSKEPAIYSGANKISLILSCKNEPGSLYSALAKIAARGINMSKLESCPVPGSNFEFTFFIDIDASVLEPGVTGLLGDLENSCETCVFLGNYSIA